MGCPVMDPTVVSPAHHFPARPRLAASCSPSRSPSRRKRFTTEELNPLLSDLSPTFTLEVLYASDTVRTWGTAAKNFVQESVASASTSEKAWGIKAALAGKKVREWYAEVGGWPWPGFDRAPINQLTKRTDQYHDGHIDSTLSAETIRSNGSGNEHYTVGKLPLKLVQEYEERIEMIRHDVATLEIEDLKDYVLNTRFRAGSRRSSLYNSQASFAIATEYDNLDDFTTIITATIIQALPTISRLETLLGIWSTRLLVLREFPSFLTDLDDGRELMMSASIAIGGHSSQQLKQRSDFSPKAFSDIRAVLKDQIAELGRRLDRMLDLLESSVDTLPDAWVDGLDNIENEYSAWVVKAERLATNNELGTGRLEKDYTQDQADDQMGLERPLDIQHTTSTLNIGTQFDEISRRADSEFDMTPQSQKDTLRSKNVATGSSTIHGAGPFDLAPIPSKNALAERSLSDKAQSQGPVVNTIDTQSWNGLSDVSKTSVLPSILPSRLTHRPTPLILAASRVDEKTPDLPDAASDTSGSGSANSSYSSNKPSPEIQSAVVAEYLGSPVTVTSPTMLNREPMTPLDISLRGFGQLAEGDGVKTDQSYIPVDHLPKNERRSGGSGHVRTRSASRRSFEIVPKHEIRKIQIKRSGSYSSALSLSDPSCGQVQPSRFPVPSAPQHGEPVALGSTAPLSASKEVEDQPPPALVQNRDPGHGDFEHHPLYHSPPPVSVKSSASAKSSDLDFRTPKQKLPYHLPPVVAPGPAKSAQSLDRKLDTAGHRTPYHSPPPIIPRSAHRFQQVSDLGPGSTPVIIRKTKLGEPTSSHVSGHVEAPRTVARSSPGNFDSQLEERISSILTELPTHIRLASGPEPDAPEVMRFNSPSDPKVPKTRSPAWRLKRTQTSTPLPSMTLAPQQPKSSKSQSVTGEPDIRLYHLHQAGKTAPIKLFVRLVGEDGERVMVRIGGGWADLGEYLREYANHHGQRSVSDSPFNIQGLPSSPVTNQSSPRSRPGSRPASRPASPTSANKLSPATFFQRQQTSPAIFPSPHTPQSDPSARPSACVSWAGVDEVSPSLGLAGPKTKNVDISPSKQAWVDEMMAQARQSGGEKKGGGENAVGDLGKVGSTKRVFFKGRKEG